MIAASLADSLLTAPVIAFVVALVASLARFDLRLPESLYPILSTYLLFAIGLKGGRALSTSNVADIWQPLVASVILGVVTPLIAYLAFKVGGRLGRIDSAAIAAHYGSVSAVTFTVAISTLDQRGITYEGHVAGLLAILEVVGIIIALSIARDGEGSRFSEAVTEVLRGRSIAFLMAGLLVGLVVGDERLGPTDTLFVALFPGALALFLLEMGSIAAERLRDVRSAGWRLAALAIVIPVVNGILGAFAGDLAGLSTGGVAVMATLAASASYIAAPAAVRIALPHASPGLYVTASLGITFPFNLIVGIPFYIRLAESLT